jgi:hypothetical protein
VPVYGGRYGLGGRLSGEALLAGLQADGGMGTQASELSGAAVLYGLTAGGSMEGVVIPSWMPAVGSAAVLPNSTLVSSGAGWAGTSPGGTGDYEEIMESWGGGVLNTVGVWRSGAFISGTFLVIFGGGHGDYGGNEVMAYGPLNSNSPTWSRITDPTVPGVPNVGRSGGYPVSRHTYDTLVYLPTENQMLCIGAAGYYSLGFSFNQGDIFDFDINPTSNPWTTADTNFPAYTTGGTISGLSGYDSTTGKAWLVGNGNGQKLGCYTVSGGTWTSTNINDPNNPGNCAAAIWPAQHIMVYANGSVVYGMDVSVATPALSTLNTTGSAPSLGGTASCAWDETGGRFVFANSSTTSTLYYLTPPGSNYISGTWTWSSETFGGTAAAGGTVFGIYGRFQMVDGTGYRGALFVPSSGSAAVFYRMG